MPESSVSRQPARALCKQAQGSSVEGRQRQDVMELHLLILVHLTRWQLEVTYVQLATVLCCPAACKCSLSTNDCLIVIVCW